MMARRLALALLLMLCASCATPKTTILMSTRKSQETPTPIYRKVIKFSKLRWTRNHAVTVGMKDSPIWAEIGRVPEYGYYDTKTRTIRHRKMRMWGIRFSIPFKGPAL